jgi:tRNA(His) 5'-end guanylyltransferase
MNLALRMKENYELRQRPMLTRRTPVIIRVDGKAFHTYTRKMDRPFCAKLRQAMMRAAWKAARNIQGCQAVYMQSDEVSFLLTDYKDFVTDAWFDYNQQKLCSVAASLFSVHFNAVAADIIPEAQRPDRFAFFDARAFNVPREEVVNYFLWRALDWERNSVMMLGRAHFSHQDLMNKSSSDVHEMLHTKDVNWAKLEGWQKNGTWLLGSGSHWTTKSDVAPKYEEISKLLEARIYADKDLPVYSNPELKDVHTSHCCPHHGCKYNDPDCTVETKRAPAEGPCESCGLMLEGANGEMERWVASQWWPRDARARKGPPPRDSERDEESAVRGG